MQFIRLTLLESRITIEMTSKPTFAVTYLYPRQGLSRFDMEYYLQHHIPTTKTLWTPLGLTGAIVSETGMDTANDYVLVVVTLWKDENSWNAAKNGEAAQKLVEDVKNFTNVTPVVLPGKISN